MSRDKSICRLVISTLEETRSLELVGTKAARLGELLRAGLPVPPGFCVSVGALVELERTEVRQAVEQALARLGASRVAVRSSAVAEDAAGASFAGVYETVLNVPSELALDGLATVRASANAERARAYAQAPPATPIGAVVQTMLAVTSAGVAFTREPLTHRDAVVVEAAHGLGRGVVEGLVTPDRYVLSRAGVVLEAEVSRKEFEVVALANGGTEVVPSDPARGRAPAIDDTTVLEVARLARRCEAVFGSPQDVEWAVAAGRLWLLQSRPITRTPQARASPRG